MAQRATGPTPIDRTELRALTEMTADPVISVYLPTERVVVQSEENALKFKNVLRTVEEQLAARGIRGREKDELLQPLHDLLHDADFWHHQLEGLAIFCGRQSLRYFKLDYTVSETIEVGTTPVVKELLPAVFPAFDFYIAALSQHQVRLLRCDRHYSKRVDLSPLGIPANLTEALRYDDLQKPELLHHTTTGPGAPSRSGGGAGDRSHAFHGHGQGPDNLKVQIGRFLTAVDEGITKVVDQSALLIPAAVEYVDAIFREVGTHPNLTSRSIIGSPDRVSDADLHSAGLAIMQGYIDDHMTGTRDAFGNAVGNGRASTDVTQILEACLEGRVDSVLMADGDPMWGRFTSGEGAVAHAEREPGDEDLLDLTARKTLLQGGTAYLVAPEDVPEEASLAAIFRY